MNSISIIGKLTKDIELKYLSSGQCLGNFPIAVNQDYKDKNGQKVEKVSFFNVSVFGKQAETINNFFHKGSRIGISGELNQERWTAQDGTNRDKVVIKLQNFTFIDRKSDNQANSNQGYNQAPQGQQSSSNSYTPNNIPEIDISDEEIPF